MTSAERARASSPLDVALDVFRMRQYFDVVVRARDVASAVTRDLRFVSTVRRGLLPLPFDRGPSPGRVFGPSARPTPPGLEGRVAVVTTGGSGALASLVGVARALEEQRATGEWLTRAMEASWQLGSALVEIDGLAGVLGERHRIIADDWQAATMATVTGAVLDRAADVLEHVDFAPAALRADLAAARVSVGRVYSAAEMISHAADLCSESAGLVHGNERRWREFRLRVAALVADRS